jgi:hypothetical protein
MSRKFAVGSRQSAVMGLVALVVLLFPASALAGKSQWSVFEDHTALVKSGDSKRALVLNEIKNTLGADTLRIEIKWGEVAPQPNAKTKPAFDAANPLAYPSDSGAYPSFYPYDDLVRRANAMGFRIIITITGDAPRWATEGGAGASFATANTRVIASEYGKFAGAVAKRYSGALPGLPAVRVFSIWNEPNHKNFIKPVKEAPRIYRNLVNEAIPQIRAGAVSGATILVGELAPVGRLPKAMGPTQFLREWLCLNKRWKRTTAFSGCGNFKKIVAQGFAHHPYGPTALVPKKKDVINLLAIRRLGGYLDQAARQGRISAKLPIYNTEFGLQSNPPDRLVSTSPSRQAALINEKEEYAYRYGRLKSHSQYLLFDDPSRPGPLSVKWSGFQTGLRFAGGGKKPAYNAYRFPIVVHPRKRGAYIWGRVRPGSGRRSVQLYKGGGKSGPRIKTTPAGYFGATRKKAGGYRFKAYDAAGKLLGTSRTAKPTP